jgi:hypothetical protein
MAVKEAYGESIEVLPEAEGTPSPAEELLADRQHLWGGFTKLIVWSVVTVIVVLVLMDWALL